MELEISYSNLRGIWGFLVNFFFFFQVWVQFFDYLGYKYGFSYLGLALLDCLIVDLVENWFDLASFTMCGFAFLIIVFVGIGHVEVPFFLEFCNFFLLYLPFSVVPSNGVSMVLKNFHINICLGGFSWLLKNCL